MQIKGKTWWRFLNDRATCYKIAFNSPAGLEVLADLAEFCRATKTTFNADPRVHAVLEGRREVWLRIAEHLNLGDVELFKRYSNGVSFDPRKDEENDNGSNDDNDGSGYYPELRPSGGW